MANQIRPNRPEVNDRFPMLGFTIRTDGKAKGFEVAIAADYALFQSTAKDHRTKENFFSSRVTGPQPIEGGEAVYVLPPEVLARFAGQDKLYYALATYSNGTTTGAEIAAIPTQGSPYINLKGLSGRSLRRLQMLPSRQRAAASYGKTAGSELDWAGDAAQPGVQPAISAKTAEKTNGSAPSPTANAPESTPSVQTAALNYNDGFGVLPPTPKAPPVLSRRTSVRALDRQSFTINWDDVQVVAQPTEFSCWAASAAVTIGWRDQVSLTPETLSQIAGRTTATGLDPTQVQQFANEIGLTFEPPQSYTIDGFRNLLEAYGPLWIAADVPGLHAIVVTGMYSDGAPDGSDTYVRITDPWDRVTGNPGTPGAYLKTHNTGSRYILSWADFVKEYEGATRFDTVNLQILHAVDNGGRQPNRSGAAGYAMAIDAPGNVRFSVPRGQTRTRSANSAVAMDVVSYPPSEILKIKGRVRNGKPGKFEDISIKQVDGAVYYHLPLMNIDFDGAPNAYHPPTPGHPHGRGPGLGLDDLRNATANDDDGPNAVWVGVVTDADGQPVVQQDGPFAGFFVSTTSLQDDTVTDLTDPRRYVDATTIPFVVLNPILRANAGVDLGDLAAVIRDKSTVGFGIVADIGPRNGLGEVSKAMADLLGAPDGIEGGDVTYIFFRNANNRRIRTEDQIRDEAGKCFENWGGIDRVQELLAPPPAAGGQALSAAAGVPFRPVIRANGSAVSSRRAFGLDDQAEIEKPHKARPPAWVGQVVPLLQQERGDVPLAFLLGWIAVESGGKLSDLTDLDERGYFQLMRSESELLKLDHKRLSTDKDYSLRGGLKAVAMYSSMAKSYGFSDSDPDLFWHIVKFLHAMGAGAVKNLLGAMQEQGVTPTSWDDIRTFCSDHREELKTRLKTDPTRFTRNVDKVFSEGADLEDRWNDASGASGLGASAPFRPRSYSRGLAVTPIPIDQAKPIHLPKAREATTWEKIAIDAAFAVLTGPLGPALTALRAAAPAAVSGDVSIAIGPSAGVGFLMGMGVGAGVIFAPGGRIGVYGELNVRAGIIDSASAGVQVSIVRGGIESFNEVGFAVGGSFVEGVEATIQVLFNQSMEFRGVSFELGAGLSVEPFEIFGAVQGSLADQVAGATALSAYNGGNGLRLSPPPPTRRARGLDAGVAEAVVIAGTVLEKVISQDGKIKWSLDQFRGVKHPNDTPPIPAPPFRDAPTIQLNEWPYVEALDSDRISAWFSVDWQYNGKSVGNVLITNIGTNGALLRGLEVEAKIMDDNVVYPSANPAYAALRVRFNYRFSRAIGSDTIATTDLHLFGNGTYEQSGRWDQE